MSNEARLRHELEQIDFRLKQVNDEIAELVSERSELERSRLSKMAELNAELQTQLNAIKDKQ